MFETRPGTARAAQCREHSIFCGGAVFTRLVTDPIIIVASLQ